jgi:hypothetical protein
MMESRACKGKMAAVIPIFLGYKPGGDNGSAISPGTAYTYSQLSVSTAYWSTPPR